MARLAPGEIARIVLDALAGAGRLDHLDIEAGALFQPLGFEQAPGLFELHEPLLQLFLDALDRLIQRRARRHIVGVRVDLHRLQFVGLLPRQRIEFLDRLDLVAEERDAPGPILQMGREDLDRIAAHPERAALKIHVPALILLGDEIGQKLALVQPVAHRHLEGHRRIGLDRANTIDAGDRGDDDHVVAFEKRAGRRVAHPVDLLVDRGFLLDIGVRARHIGFRLIVVVIGDEIFDGVVRKETLELAIELGGQRLVGRQDQGRALGALDDIGDGKGLARAGDAEQDLGLVMVADPRDEILDRRRLVAHGRIVRGDLEGDAAFRLVGPGRAMGNPEFAILMQRIARGDEVLQGLDGRRDAAFGQGFGVFQGYVHAGDGIEPGSGPLLRIAGTTHGGAACRLHRLWGIRLAGLALGRRGLATLARLRSGCVVGFGRIAVAIGYALGLRLGGALDRLGPGADGARKGLRRIEVGLRRFTEATGGLGSFGRLRKVRQRPAPCRRGRVEAFALVDGRVALGGLAGRRLAGSGSHGGTYRDRPERMEAPGRLEKRFSARIMRVPDRRAASSLRESGTRASPS